MNCNSRRPALGCLPLDVVHPKPRGTRLRYKSRRHLPDVGGFFVYCIIKLVNVKPEEWQLILLATFLLMLIDPDSDWARRQR